MAQPTTEAKHGRVPGAGGGTGSSTSLIMSVRVTVSCRANPQECWHSRPDGRDEKSSACIVSVPGPALPV